MMPQLFGYYNLQPEGGVASLPLGQQPQSNRLGLSQLDQGNSGRLVPHLDLQGNKQRTVDAIKNWLESSPQQDSGWGR